VKICFLLEKEGVMVKYCKKCCCMMEYRPRSFQEHIKEIIGEQNKREYWECPTVVISRHKGNSYADNKSGIDQQVPK